MRPLRLRPYSEQDYRDNNRDAPRPQRCSCSHLPLHVPTASVLGLQNAYTYRGDDSILSATAKVDEALKHGLLSYSPHDMLNGELLARRVRLLVRMNGLGVRSQAELLAQAWT